MLCSKHGILSSYSGYCSKCVSQNLVKEAHTKLKENLPMKTFTLKLSGTGLLALFGALMGTQIKAESTTQALQTLAEKFAGAAYKAEVTPDPTVICAPFERSLQLSNGTGVLGTISLERLA